MSKLASMKPLAPVLPSAKIRSRSTGKADTTTYEGGAGYSRKPKSELFLLAVSNMVGESTFYEKADTRDKRFVELIHEVVRKDADWVARFIPYLRNEMNMRSASIVMAVEYVIAGGPNGRKVIDSAIVRADEPAEVLGYYRATHGRNVPQPIKRGVADAVKRLYNERNVLKYDGDSNGYRMGDVIDITHPSPSAPWQSSLFKYVLDKRHNRETGISEGLNILQAHAQLMAIPVENRRKLLEAPDFNEVLNSAGMTWESVSGWLQGPMDAKAWEAIIPSMGYMALLRNLRNFEQAKVSKEVMEKVYAKLTDPEQVAKSRQFPIRFYSAFSNVEGLKTKAVLEDAIQGTLQNVPVLRGKTLVLVDCSGSMTNKFSKNGDLTYAEAAGLFGAAIALRAESAELYKYGSNHNQVSYTPATPLLQLARQFKADMGGTNTFGTLNSTFRNHDRVIILTDEQAFGGYGLKPAVNINVPIYTFNLAGYKQGMLPSGSGNRYTFGGLSDAGFKLIELLERGDNEAWPF